MRDVEPMDIVIVIMMMLLGAFIVDGVLYLGGGMTQPPIIVVAFPVLTVWGTIWLAFLLWASEPEAQVVSES